MKVSVNLLKAIALGVALGATATSCTNFEDVSEFEQAQEPTDPSTTLGKNYSPFQEEITRTTPRRATSDDECNDYLCGPCGMG